ncbi:MAG: TonB-dependent receptor, partial [Minwuiales bacterium]|nr:TonB-dependent receptor [Minwuiales bacterium]
MAIGTAGAQAQDETSDTEDTQILGTISVTATRNPIKAFEYPGMVTVIGRDDILTRQPSTPDDILRTVPNVEFTGGPRRTGEVPSIRGFEGADVVVLFDGARQNFGSAHDGRFFIDPSLLKQVEVIRGPASSLYGSGGTGGVIEFRTVDADDLLGVGERLGASVSAGYQTANSERSGSFSAFGKPGAGIDLVGSVTLRQSNSIELGDGNTLHDSDDDLLAGLAKASWSFADHHRVEGSFLSFNNDAEEPNNGQGAGGDNLTDKEVRSNTWRVGYGYKNPDNRLIDLDVIAYYTDLGVDERRLDADGAGPVGEQLKRDVDTVGLRLDNRSRFDLVDSVSTILTYGGEFYADEQDGESGTGERDGVPDADALFYGIFAQAEVNISEPLGFIPGDLLIIPGLRYDDYEASSDIADDNDANQLSPRIGVSYLPNDWLLFFANYAHAFRAPTFDELFTTGTHFVIPIGPGITNRFVPNPELDPQSTRTVEFGGGITFNSLVVPGDLFQVKVSRFFIWGDDFIDTDVNQPEPFIDCNPFIPGNCDGTTTTVNVPDAELDGMEVEASYESSRFLWSFGFSSIDGENEDTGEKLGVLTPDQFTVNTAA